MAKLLSKHSGSPSEEARRRREVNQFYKSNFKRRLPKSGKCSNTEYDQSLPHLALTRTPLPAPFVIKNDNISSSHK